MRKFVGSGGIIAVLLILLAASWEDSSGRFALAAGPGEGGIHTVTYTNVAFEYDGTGYVTAPFAAPFPFNAVVPEWESSGEPIVEMRSGTDLTWGRWTLIEHNHDFVEEGEKRDIGDMLLVPAVDKTHTRVQLRVAVESPSLDRLHLTFIDTSEGPTTADLIARQQALDARLPAADLEGTAANPKPTVIGREVWCSYAECSYNACMADDPLKWEPVTHLIVHHTVSSNNSADWAAVVRAIFRFHALEAGRCWGDIGYNYLIDMNGVIYEGHRGGDNVVGTHAAGGNKGSMGVSLIGLFSWESEYPGGIRPPDPMLNSLVDILAWKADQRRINVFEGGPLPDLEGGRPYLMGHRDVYGTTTCPGGQAHALLPWVRDRVAERLPWLINDYIYIDELSSQFSKYASLRWDAPKQCGYNTHSYYTWSTDDPNATPYWGEWRFDVPQNGLYELQVFVPYCNTGTDETGSAKYTVFHSNGTSQLTVDQERRVGQWTSLGSYPLALASDNRLRLTDITNDSGLGVWYDAVRLRRLQNYGRVDLRAPGSDDWVGSGWVKFRWDVVDVVNPSSMRLRVATDQNMNQVVKDITLSASARDTDQSLTVSAPSFYWQVTATGWTQANSPIGSFKVDGTPPSAVIEQVFRLSNGNFVVAVEARDDQSGIDTISIQYRQVGQSGWQDLVVDTKVTDVKFIPPDSTKTYEFRLSAKDRVGNTKGYPVSSDGSTEGAILLNRSNYAPVIKMR